MITRQTLVTLWGVVACVATIAQPGTDVANEAREILNAGNVKGGLVVHLGCADGEVTAALHAEGAFLVHGLDADAANVQRAREHIRSLGLYGPVSVTTLRGSRLPYIDNLVNLLIVSTPWSVGNGAVQKRGPAAEGRHRVERSEVLRVLAPRGAVVVVAADGTPRAAFSKPWPDEIDEWPQYLHGADNNAVARDSVVGPPRHLQWVDQPNWSRSHMSIPTVASMVSATGRLFTIEDRATPENPFLPGRFALIARDAFNGVTLWRHDIAEWEPVTRYIKDVAIQSQDRMAAVGDVLYCTLGLNAPVTALDAATGGLIRTYEGTDRTQEITVDQGIIFAVVGDRMNAARYNIVKKIPSKGTSLGGSDPEAPFDGAGFRGAYTPEASDRDDPVCAIVAVDAASGRRLWREDDIHGYVACTLAVKGNCVVYQTTHGMACLHPRTGARIWRVDKPIKRSDGTEANPLVLSDTAVYAKEGKMLVAYALVNGARKWSAPIANNYEKAADLFIAGGYVWTGGARKPTSYDPDTGLKVKTITQKMTGPMGHDRCYRNFITERYYINSKTGGVDFVDLVSGQEFPNHWTRGTCGTGVLPCNGLLYAPPYSCQCSAGEMMKDFNAYTTEPGLATSEQPIGVVRSVRLLRGPAYADVSAARGTPARARDTEADPRAWPAYRHDGSRGGATSAKVPVSLKQLWTATIGGQPSAPTVADGKVFVADVDGHTMVALDGATGKVVWRHTVGARVDSPPTCYKEILLFGSRDGWVHCLRASDGQLAWQFRDLPERLIGAFGQLESPWPVNGSILVTSGTAYFAAGRGSFLDGGIFLYGLDPFTGEVMHARQFFGPFTGNTGFPATGNRAGRTDILVTDGTTIYMRHKAFTLDLRDATPPRPHVLPSAGFLDGAPQHRTYWTVGTRYGFTRIPGPGPSGDILVWDGSDYYDVQGFPVHRHSYFDPRIKGYRLSAGSTDARAAPESKQGAGERARDRKGKAKRKGNRVPPPEPRWTSDIPLTGKAMVLAGDIVFVAGAPAFFPPNQDVGKYEQAHAGKLGGVLWAASAVDGRKLAEVKLDAPPRWDGMAAVSGGLFVSLQNGTIVCFGE